MVDHDFCYFMLNNQIHLLLFAISEHLLVLFYFIRILLKNFHFLFQNFLNESLKFLDKMYPNNSHLSGLHTVASVSSSLDTKPLHLDAKSLLNHGVSTTTTTNNNNSTTVALETKKWSFLSFFLLCYIYIVQFPTKRWIIYTAIIYV